MWGLRPVGEAARVRPRPERTQDQRSGALTEGVVKDLLTNSTSHPHGIKVRLEDGQVGRVKEIIG
ncbi:MAG: YwbE family protein [Bacteroidetes bacterium]|nr:YwbE family protein [Bacteroidota bacterium]